MGKTAGIFLNLQCDCHRVASTFTKLINHRTTWLPDLTAQHLILPLNAKKRQSINTNVDGSFQRFQKQFSMVKVG